MRSKSRTVSPVVPCTSATRTVGLLRRDSSSNGKRPLVRRIDSRTKKHAMLNADVARLTQHVQRLQELRELLREKTMSRAEAAAGSIPRTMRAYFSVFRHGYQPHLQTELDGSMVSNKAFLLSVFDEDVQGGGFRGIATQQAQWEQYTALFGGPQLKLVDAVVVPLDETEDGDWKVMFRATVAHSGHVTLKTIEMLFPHILSNPALVMSMLGRPISGDGCSEFVFDCHTGRIVEARLHVDLVATFAQIVERPSDLAMLFERAQLTHDSFIGKDDGNSPSQDVPIANCIDQRKAFVDTTELLGPTERRVRSDDPMSIKNILTVEDTDYESDSVGATSGQRH